jgi:release factor glutamine methyltransferase
MAMDRQQEEALAELGRALQASSYRFITPTPNTHALVLARATGDRGEPWARDLRDVFGWSKPFKAESLDARLLALLDAAGGLIELPDGFKSAYRFSSLGALLLAHSAYPTSAADSIFFGPDTYRFCAFLGQCAPVAETVLDIGCGSGAGGLWLASKRPLRELVLTDINERALAVARANACLAGVEVRTLFSDLFAAMPALPDLCIANPPYMKDAQGRAYRDGGGQHGEGLSIRMVREWLNRARAGQSFLLYTGSAIVAGLDRIQQLAVALAREHGATIEYAELDPDVFGEELALPGYEDVERIAAVGMHLRC